MKDTREIREFIEATACWYCTKLRLVQNEIPDIFFEGIKLPIKKESIFDEKDHKAQFFYGGASMIRIDLPAHDSIEDLENSIVHELIHIKYPDLEHGPTFFKHLRRAMR
jgi:hypothetical protein